MKQKQAIAHWNGPKQSEEVVLENLKTVPKLYGRYSRMEQDWRERFIDFCCGRKTLPFTYDPFFKKIFHPDNHPERLSRLISALIKRNVKVRGILPGEDSMMDGESLLILDILVELEDGFLSNIEIQKCPYAFPAERMSCYSSDLVMREYTRIKGRLGKNFTYRDMKKVYTIVLFEESTGAFHMEPSCYIHYGSVKFNTGLELELLQEYCLIALDEFRKYPYPKIRSEQMAWLSFLVTEDIGEADRLIEEYPWLEEIYREAAGLRTKPEEVLGMYSEALRILDRNTVHYMIDEQKKVIEQQKTRIKEQEQEFRKAIGERDMALQEKETQLEEQNRVIEELKRKLELLDQKDK